MWRTNGPDPNWARRPSGETRKKRAASSYQTGEVTSYTVSPVWACSVRHPAPWGMAATATASDEILMKVASSMHAYLSGLRLRVQSYRRDREGASTAQGAAGLLP